MSDYFNDDQDEFRDNPFETDGKGNYVPVETAAPPQAPPRQRQAAPAPRQAVQAKQPVQQTYADETYLQQIQPDSEDEDDFSEVLTNASLRLEQGQLYQMIMNQNIFDGVKADPKAVKAVTKSIRRFAREQMEIMLGMKQPAVEPPRSATEGSSPFNALEVKLLKDLASKMSQGRSTQPDADQTANKLNSISAQPKQVVQQQLKPISQNAPAQKPLANKPAAPIQRQAPAQSVITPEALREPDGFKPLPKDPSQMTTEELIEYNRAAAARQAGKKAARPANALPMPTYAQEEMLATEKAYAASSSVSAIMHIINNQPKK